MQTYGKLKVQDFFWSQWLDFLPLWLKKNLWLALVQSVCVCVAGACKQHSSFVLHPIFIKLSKYLYYPSKTNPIENRHGWVILRCSGRCKRWNFMEFRLVNKIAPPLYIRFWWNFQNIFITHLRQTLLKIVTVGWFWGVLGGVKGVISEWRMTNKAKGFRRVLQLALV